VSDAVNSGRSPLVSTERNDHLDSLEQLLAPSVRHLVVLRAETGKRERQAVAERLATIPTGEGRVVLATGKYVGEGFDDARLDSRS
jgi:superfamily II DNA or RNA helicase